MNYEKTDCLSLVRNFVGAAGLNVFDREIRERTHAVFPSALSTREIALIGGIERLEQLFKDDNTQGEFADFLIGDHLVRLSDMLRRSGRRAIDIVAEQIEKGNTVRWRNAEDFNGNILDFVEAVANVFEGECTANAYLTPPNQAGFPAHFDNTDVFIVQVYGQKQWQIHTSYTNCVALPVRDTAWSPERYQVIGDAEQIVLSPGDVLYIPRGVMHSTSAGSVASLHWTFSLDPLTYLDTLKSVLEEWAQEDVRLRKSFMCDTKQFPQSRQQLLKLVEDMARYVEQMPVPKGRLPGSEEMLAGRKHDTLKDTISNLE